MLMSKTLREAWDGQNLKFTSRITVGSEVMEQWYELIQIVSGVRFSDEDDAVRWQFESSGKYSVQSLYAVINNRGVKQVFTPVMWKIPVPPRLHIFLWLLANNKALTRDNLAKRRQVDDKTCLFCNENESLSHVFFKCCVAQCMWQMA
jgi:hypothetical protein